MLIGLNVPQRVFPSRVLVTSHLLLFVTPVRQFDFVREQVASRQSVPQPKLAAESLEPVFSLLIILSSCALGDFHNEIIIGITSKAGETVARNFILEINLADRRSNVVGVKALFGRDMLETNFGAGENIFKGKFVPGIRGRSVGGRSVNDSPNVVVISVGVESDLLLCVR